MFDIATHVKQLAIYAVPLLLGIICHEVAHGYIAYLLGDPTAKNAGRLTLNPLKHLDPLGTLILILTRIIGWAKPVPINPANFKNIRRDILLVSIAGPLANILLAFLFFILFKSSKYLSLILSEWLITSLLLPIRLIFVAGIIINIILALFNLIPIPPLDGSKIIAFFLPLDLAIKYMRLEKIGFLILIIMAFSGILQNLFDIVLTFVYNII
jgi:Zn-dependent protease